MIDNRLTRVEGVNVIERSFGKFSKEYQNKINEMLQERSLQAITNIKAKTPVVTGNLRRSEGTEHLGQGQQAIYAKANYAEYVEDKYARDGKSFFYDEIDKLVDILNDDIKDSFKGVVRVAKR